MDGALVMSFWWSTRRRMPDDVLQQVNLMLGSEVLDMRWATTDSMGAFMSITDINDQDMYGGWSGTHWVWTAGWLVDEHTLSDWAFFAVHMRRLRRRVLAGFSYVSF